MKKPGKPTQWKLRLNLRIKRLQLFADPAPREKPQTYGVGFTGSRNGADNAEQQKTLTRLLENLCCRAQSYENMELSHGDCQGWDETCHRIALKLGLRITIHPPDNPSKRAFCKKYTHIMPPKPYLERNKNIVDSCRYLVAVSSTDGEEWRSGTWSTVRYARKQNKAIFIVMPDGSLRSEGV